MNTYNLIRSAFRALLKNGFRTFLTMLGIIIGVAAVIVMDATGKGTEASINAEISSLGTNMVMVSPAAVEENGVNQAAGSQQSLKTTDPDAIRKECKSVLYVSPLIRTMTQVKYSSSNWNTSLLGISGEYLSIRDLKISEGVPFTQKDILNSAKVCLIGNTVRKKLFGKENPIGKTIRIGQVPFTVTGLIKEKGQSGFGQDQDDIILAPYTSVENRITGTDYFHQIYISALTDKAIPDAIREVENVLRHKHQLTENDKNDFEISSQSELTSMASSITGTLTILLSSIAAISLLVGGIGIMNIMYVSVTERTREIGIRLAIGATSNDVLLQLLIEAVVLSLTAGAIGIVAGYLFSMLVSSVAGLETIVTTSSIYTSFGFCTVIGIFFGWYPARKAARLNPVEALRYE